MKFWILFLVCEALSEPLTTVPAEESEKLTTIVSTVELPEMTLDDFKTRQNYIEVGETDFGEEVDSAELPESSEVSTTIVAVETGCTDSNMEINTCGPRCYQTCAVQPRGFRRSRAVCEAVNATGCYPGCFCKSGYVRLNEKCVLAKDCPTRACRLSNEEFAICGTPCPITCDSYEHSADIESRCPTEICVKGCFCKAGHVRFAGLCIEPSRCPRPLVA